MKLYHATDPSNVDSILSNGLKLSLGEIYLSDSQEGAARWKVGAVLEGREIAVVEVSVHKKHIKPGVDHSPLMQTIFGCGQSFVTNKPIGPFSIKGVQYLSFKQKHHEPK